MKCGPTGPLWRLLLLTACGCAEARRAHGPKAPGAFLGKGRQGSVELQTGSEVGKPPPGFDKYLEQEKRAQSDFVRRCAVVMTTKDPDMMPMEQVDSICRATDKIFKCKREIKEQFRKAQRIGTSMARVCEIAYRWFQEEYGMLCPHQCEKLQCKATCDWLKTKRKLKEKAAALKAEEERLKKQEKEVAKLKAELNETSASMKNLTASAADDTMEAAAANNSLAELNAEILAAKQEEASAKAASAPGTERLRELQAAADAADKEVKDEAREVGRLQMQAHVTVGQMQILQSEAHKLDSGVSEARQREKAAAEAAMVPKEEVAKILQPRVDALRRLHEQAKMDVTAAEAALKSAEASGSSGPDDAKREAELQKAREDRDSYKEQLKVAMAALERKKLEVAQAEGKQREAQTELGEELKRRSSVFQHIQEEQAKVDDYSLRERAMERKFTQAREDAAERQRAIDKEQDTMGPYYLRVQKLHDREQSAEAAFKETKREAVLRAYNGDAEHRWALQKAQEGATLVERLRHMEQRLRIQRQRWQLAVEEHRAANESLPWKRPPLAVQHDIGLGLLEFLGY